MDIHNPQLQYVEGQMHPRLGALLADFERRCVQARTLHAWQMDLRYGADPRETLDLCRQPSGAVRGTLAYFHAGYWQSRDKAQFHFLAHGLRTLGWDLALVNYPLCPQATVAGITQSAARALDHLRSLQAAGDLQGPLVLAGHSAGAHLAVELALRCAAGSNGRPAPACVLAISGIYDLRPLVHTSLNQRLQLDEASAGQASPVLRALPGCMPALFVVGAEETSAFHAQSRSMADRWLALGNTAGCLEAPQQDHFSVLDWITEPDGPVDRLLRSWSGG